MILKGKFGWGIAEGKLWPLRHLAFQPAPIRSSVISLKSLVTHSLANCSQADSLARSFRSRSKSPEALVSEAFNRLTHELQREKKQLKKGKAFLDFPLSVLADPRLNKNIREFLKQGLSPQQAVSKSFQKWESAFKKLDDSYLRLRIQDLEDLRRRLLIQLGSASETFVPKEPFVAFGKDLYVTDLLRLLHSPLKGVALQEGNESAHGVMLAKALRVPLVGNVGGLLSKAREGELAFLSGDKVYLHEKPAKIGTGPFLKEKNGPVPIFRTKDGVSVVVRANVQLPDEIPQAKAAGAMGVGLFRTEFLWMKEKLSLGEETKIYRDALQTFYPNPVIFRFADLGSDKPLQKIRWPEEKNPALGWRGLRLLLDRPEILSRQLQALSSAAEKETLHLLLPMVRTRDEVLEFLDFQRPFMRKHKGNVRFGIMIETLSSVDLIERLPREISFVSLGTNDLLQYFFAVDRLHPTLKADWRHPAFIRFLSEIIQKCRQAKKSVSICGEMAADSKTLPILLGLGYREFSVSVSKIHDVALALREVSISGAKKLAGDKKKE